MWTASHITQGGFVGRYKSRAPTGGGRLITNVSCSHVFDAQLLCFAGLWPRVWGAVHQTPGERTRQQDCERTERLVRVLALAGFPSGHQWLPLLWRLSDQPELGGHRWSLPRHPGSPPRRPRRARPPVQHRADPGHLHHQGHHSSLLQRPELQQRRHPAEAGLPGQDVVPRVRSVSGHRRQRPRRWHPLRHHGLGQDRPDLQPSLSAADRPPPAQQRSVPSILGSEQNHRRHDLRWSIWSILLPGRLRWTTGLREERRLEPGGHRLLGNQQLQRAHPGRVRARVLPAPLDRPDRGVQLKTGIKLKRVSEEVSSVWT